MKNIRKSRLTSVTKAVLIFFVACFLLTSGLITRVQAAEPKPVDKHVYYLIIDKLSIYDISSSTMPELSKLIDNGAVGMASTRTLKGNNTLNSSLTIGAGNLARTTSNGIMAFNADENVYQEKKPAAELYGKLTGIDPGSNACLLVNLPEIVLGMSTESVTTVPGAMGTALKQNDYKVCVLGNADYNGVFMRPSVAIGMDSLGRVPLGDVGPNTYNVSPESILSCETDYEYLLQQLKKHEKEAHLIILELSDLARFQYAPIAFEEVQAREKLLCLGKIDDFIAAIAEKMDPSHDILLISGLSPSKNDIALKNNFIPVIAYGSGIKQGSLTSSATRRDFIIANTDIAPSILGHFGIEPDPITMIGQPATVISKTGDTLFQAQQITNSSSTVNRLRNPLIRGYIFALIIIILLTMLVLLKVFKQIKCFQVLLVSIVAVPLALLFLGKIPFPADFLYILAAIIFTALITWASLRIFRNPLGAFTVISLFTIILLNIDLLTGTTMIQSSVLGYDPMAGARYYGIGNEYMGILIGGTIGAGAALYEGCRKKWLLGLIALVFLFQCYIIANPALGANSDGFLTAPAAFLVTLVLFSDIKIHPRTLLLIAGLIIITVLGVSYYDMHRPLHLQSHIGRAANQIASGGWQQILTIVVRKLGMNIKLIRYTIWSRVFIVILVVLALSIYIPVGAMKRIRQERPYMLKGFAGIVTAALVGLVVNDSGIVAASTTSIYLVVPLLLMLLEQMERQ